MTIQSWLPAVLGYLIPVGLFLLAWGGMEPKRALRAATLGALVLAVAAVGYFAVGFAFHLGGARVLAPEAPGLEGLAALWGPTAEWGIIGLNGFFLAGPANTPEALALYVTYLPLVVASVLLVSLSLSGRAPGWQLTIAALFTAIVLVPIAACWAWGRGWLAQLGRSLNLGHGFVDYAGSGVIYFAGGMAALGALVGLGERLPHGRRGEPAEMPPAHFPLLANLGALLFGLGWLGWSLSAPFHVAGAQVDWPRVATNGLLAGAGAILASQFYCWLALGHTDPLMAARGMAAGFVAVSAGAPFIPAGGAFALGAVAGFLLPIGVYIVERGLRLPDETATIALGLFAGLLGLLAVPLLADGRWGQGWNGHGIGEYLTVPGQGVTGYFPAPGFRGGGNGQLLAQLAGIGAIGVLGFLPSWLLFLLFRLPQWVRQLRRAPSPAEIPSTAEPAAAEGVTPRRRGRQRATRQALAEPSPAQTSRPATETSPPLLSTATEEPPPTPPDTASLSELWEK